MSRHKKELCGAHKTRGARPWLICPMPKAVTAWVSEETKHFVFLVLIFLPAWSYAAENQSSACRIRCLEDASTVVPNCQQKSNG